MKPLFIPLKTEYFEAFREISRACGEDEFTPYYNERPPQQHSEPQP
jgi:hypothetical protein